MKEMFTIDLGNTNQNFIFHNDTGVASPKLPLIELNDFLKHYNAEDSTFLISDVTKNKADLTQLKNKKFISDLIKDKSFLDMPMNYSNTIGADRICQNYFAYKTLTNAIVFDCGTFTTIDYITEQGFLGGNIYPGLEKIVDTYNQADKLEINFQDFLNANSETIHLSNNTKDAMISATKHIYTLIMGELIKETDKKIILTGGASIYFKHLAEEYSHIEYRPHFIHESLYFIGEKLNENSAWN